MCIIYFGSIILNLSFFPGKLNSRWDDPFITYEIFDCGATLISNPKLGKQMKVNDQRLNPYMENESLSLAISLNLKKVGHHSHDPLNSTT